MGVGYPGVVLGDAGPLADSELHIEPLQTGWLRAFPFSFPSRSAAQKKEPTQRILWRCLLSLACTLWGGSLYPGSWEVWLPAVTGSLWISSSSSHYFSVPQGPPGPPGKEGPPGVAGQKGNVVSQPLQVVVTWHTPVVTGWWTLHPWGSVEGARCRMRSWS